MKEVYVLIYQENSDARCGVDVEVYGDLNLARKRLNEWYRNTLTLLYHDCGVIRDDYYCEIDKDSANIVEGIDSFSWHIETHKILRGGRT